MKNKAAILPLIVAVCIAVSFALVPSCKPDKPECDTTLQDSLNVRELRLKEREMALREREMAVAEREQQLGMKTSSSYAGNAGSSGTKTEADEAGRKTIKNGRKNYDQKDPQVAYKKPVLDNPGQFPESSERLLTADDLAHKSAFGRKVMLNEIYARHGYIFTDADMRKHFNGESWYKGTEKNIGKLKLTDIEIQNVAFLK